MVFRLIFIAILSIGISVGIASYISRDELHNLEIRNVAKISAIKIRETLALINSLEPSQRRLIRQHLKRENIFYITGSTRFYFPQVVPEVKNEDLRTGIIEIIDNLNDFNIVAAGQSLINDINVIDSDLSPSELISLVVELEDSSYVWIGIREENFEAISLFPLVLPILLISLPIVFIILLTLLWLVRPLRQLSVAAESIGSSIHSIPKLPTSNLQEIKNVTLALKSMHSNLRKQFDTLMVTLGALSHDLRTPLQKLQLRAELIKNKTEREKIHQDIEELHKRVEDGLFYLRVSANANKDNMISLPSQKINLAEKVSQLIKDYQTSSANIHLIYDQTKKWQISVNWISMARALGNLIDNGLIYGQKVEVKLLDERQQFIIQIRDFGEGIPDSDIAKAMTPFTRLDNIPTIKPPETSFYQTSGSGLGLAIAKAIVERQNGELTLTNHHQSGLIAKIILRTNLDDK